jgi:hypothetical protein
MKEKQLQNLGPKKRYGSLRLKEENLGCITLIQVKN